MRFWKAAKMIRVSVMNYERVNLGLRSREVDNHTSRRSDEGTDSKLAKYIGSSLLALCFDSGRGGFWKAMDSRGKNECNC